MKAEKEKDEKTEASEWDLDTSTVVDDGKDNGERVLILFCVYLRTDFISRTADAGKLVAGIVTTHFYCHPIYWEFVSA